MPYHNPQEQFPAHSMEQWLEQIKKDLKGQPLESLQSHTQDHISIEPAYYTPHNSPYPALSQRHVRAATIISVHGDEIEVNKLILSLLAKGAESLWLYLYAPVDLEKLLYDVDLNLITTTFYYQNKEARQSLKAHQEYWQKNAPQSGNALYAALDPTVYFAQQGQFATSAAEDYRHLQELLKTPVRLALPQAYFANAGATPAQQLGIALASVYELLVRLSANAETPLQLNLAVGSDYFSEIAKCKAWPLLYAQLQRELGQELPPVTLTASGLWSNKTTVDAYNNLVRSTSEGMAALLGGAQEIALQPYDITFRQNGPFGLRIALNQMLMLRHESHLDKNNDPAAGAYFMESLTDELAEKGWEFFKALEYRGGLVAALQEGYLQNEVQYAAKATLKELQNQEKVLVGANKFQPEGPIPQPLPSPWSEPANAARALPPLRWAETFEKNIATAEK